MATETIIRHTCDQCGKVAEEISGKSFLPCGGSNSWSGWDIKQKGTASHFYGTNASKEFCSYDCAIAFLTKEKEWQKLTE